MTPHRAPRAARAAALFSRSGKGRFPRKAWLFSILRTPPTPLSRGNFSGYDLPMHHLRARDHSRIKELFEILRTRLPLRHTVTLSLPVMENHGEHVFDGKAHRIRISAEAAYPIQVDAVIHEYAHAMVDDTGRPTESRDHGDRWARAYGRVYRMWEDHWQADDASLESAP